MEETPVRATPDFIDDIRLKIDVEGAGNVFARGGLREESAEAGVVGRGILDDTTVGLEDIHKCEQNLPGRSTHTETVLNSVELPCKCRTIISIAVLNSRVTGSRQKNDASLVHRYDVDRVCEQDDGLPTHSRRYQSAHQPDQRGRR